jgi:subtilase family serine protease
MRSLASMTVTMLAVIGFGALPADHPGVPITVSSGDSGYGVEWPAASQYVTAVGGTS